jgi:hypothetical protein
MEKLNHDLQEIAEEMALPAQCQQQSMGRWHTYYWVEDSNCLSNILPPCALHNFGILKEWFEENHQNPCFKALLKDWGKWPGPDGWDTHNESS